jgi:hypothetical protein
LCLREVDKIAVKGLLGMYFYSCLWLKPDGLQSPEDIGDVFSDHSHSFLESSLS